MQCILCHVGCGCSPPDSRLYETRRIMCVPFVTNRTTLAAVRHLLNEEGIAIKQLTNLVASEICAWPLCFCTDHTSLKGNYQYI